MIPIASTRTRQRVLTAVAAVDTTTTTTTSDKNNNKLKDEKEKNDDNCECYIQVVSDVDDTLKSSGGVNIGGIALGGIDVQYKRGDIYPGVAQFMLELSLHPPLSCQHKCHYSTTKTRKPLNIAILTARAEEFKAALEIKPTSKLAKSLRQTARNMGIGKQTNNDSTTDDDDDWGIGPVLYGSVAEWIYQANKGRRKFKNMELLIQQQQQQQQVDDPSSSSSFPPLIQYIFVGDTGEMDQEAGESMLRNYPEYCQAVFLHVVSGQDDDEEIQLPPPKLICGRPLVFFRTYVGAAAMATRFQMMSVQGLQRVVQSATEALAAVPETSSKWIDLKTDVALAQAILLGQ